jgi:hypothetical protein
MDDAVTLGNGDTVHLVKSIRPPYQFCQYAIQFLVMTNFTLTRNIISGNLYYKEFAQVGFDSRSMSRLFSLILFENTN